MLASDRKHKILELVEREGSLASAKVASALGVSLMTVRRDLEELEERGLLQRVHGGAQALGEHEAAYGLRRRREFEAKRRIGLFAANLIQDNETVYLDAGTTTMEVALGLRRRKLSGVFVVTHSVNIAAELSGLAGITVYQLGGEIYRQTYSAVGPRAISALNDFSFDRAFIGCQGFDLNAGITNSNLAEVDIKLAAIRCSRWACLVADATKNTHVSFARIAPLSAVQAILTDARLPEPDLAALLGAGLEVIIASERRTPNRA